jgi:hypothetical protein
MAQGLPDHTEVARLCRCSWRESDRKRSHPASAQRALRVFQLSWRSTQRALKGYYKELRSGPQVGDPLPMDERRAIVSPRRGRYASEGGMGSRYSRARGASPSFVFVGTRFERISGRIFPVLPPWGERAGFLFSEGNSTQTPPWITRGVTSV